MTTIPFHEYASPSGIAVRIAKEQLVRERTETLCKVLKADYINHSIISHQHSIYLADAGDSFSTNYHQSCIDALTNGECDYDFFIKEGRKYLKIVMSAQGSESVHAFVDKKTGEVYKAASYKGPAKGVRFDLNIPEHRAWLLENADLAGSYHYKN